MQPIPVVVALILKGEAILMCQRSEKKIYPLHWEFPGGKVEPGETEIEALKRELREELDIEVISAERWFQEVAEYSNKMVYAISYFLVREFAGEPKNLEFNAIDWVTEESIDTLLHLSGNASILEKLAAEGFPA